MKRKTIKRAVKTVKTAQKKSHTAQQAIQDQLSTHHGVYFGMSARDAKRAYQELHALGTMLQCQYAIELQNVYNIATNVPWFSDKFPISWLATEVEFTNGSNENESFYAGAWQFNHVTQRTLESIDVTFIETAKADIATSAGFCQGLAFRTDGTVLEPKHYTFKLSIRMLGKKTVSKDYLVSVKEFTTSLSSSGRSEVAKTQVTFQVIAPYGLFAKSPAKR